MTLSFLADGRNTSFVTLKRKNLPKERTSFWNYI
jgi:hypothetical protein